MKNINSKILEELQNKHGIGTLEGQDNIENDVRISIRRRIMIGINSQGEKEILTMIIGEN